MWWVYFREKYHNSENTTTPLSYTMIDHGSFKLCFGTDRDHAGLLARAATQAWPSLALQS